MTVVHETITLERHYAVPPARVFRAFADPAAKALWFPSEQAGWIVHGDTTLDFRVGGEEKWAMGPAGGEPNRFTGRYHDIVPDERIVFAYEMTVAGRRISVSLQSVELTPSDGGTRLVLIDHGAYLDGLDAADTRRRGIEPQLDRLALVLDREGRS